MPREHSLSIALIGNPGCGLTTLFNQMTGGLQHSGRFSTEAHKTKEGPVRRHRGVNVIELPGIYSLSAYSIDDVATRDILLRGKPDVIVNVVDATSIERNLYLTLQLMELELPMVLALNMMDEVRGNEIDIDIQKLSDRLTIPVIPISASKNEGIHDLIHYALEAAANKTIPQKIDFCSGFVHTAIHTVAHLIDEDAKRAHLPLRFCCTKIVEGDEPIFSALQLQAPELDIIAHLIDDMEHHLSTDREAAMADMRYAFIGNLCSETIKKETPDTKEHLRSIRMDRVLTHKFFAIPIFLCIMLLVFYLTFSSVGAFLISYRSPAADVRRFPQRKYTRIPAERREVRDCHENGW